MSEMIWAAGLFVGEGSVIVVSRPPRGRKQEQHYLTLALLMADERAVKRFHAAVQPHVEYTRKVTPAQIYSYIPKSRPDCLRVYRYSLTGAPAISVCRALYPYLNDSDKGDQIMKCFEKLGLDL
jgi:hypothetical protein